MDTPTINQEVNAAMHETAAQTGTTPTTNPRRGGRRPAEQPVDSVDIAANVIAEQHINVPDPSAPASAPVRTRRAADPTVAQVRQLQKDNALLTERMRQLDMQNKCLTEDLEKAKLHSSKLEHLFRANMLQLRNKLSILSDDINLALLDR